MGKIRAATINKKRAVEMALAESAASGENAEEPKQGLYAEWQTELFVPHPVVDVSSDNVIHGETNSSY